MSRIRLRRWLYAACILCLILAGLGLAARWAWREYAPLLAREQIEAALSRALERPVRVGEVVLRLWLGRMDLQDVVIAAAPGEPPEPMLTLRRAAVSLGISSLWRRELVLSRIALEEFTLRIVGGTSGGLPAPVLQDSFQVGPVTLRIRTLQMGNGRVVYHGTGGRPDLEALGIEATARLGGSEIDLTVRAAELRVPTPSGREVLERVDGGGRLRADHLLIRELGARWRGRDVRLRGEIRNPFTAPELSLAVRGRFDLALLAGKAGISWPVLGLAEAQGELSGPPDDLRVSAKVAIPDLTAGPVRARQVSLRGGWGDGNLRLDEVQARVFGGSLQGTLLVSPDRLDETRTTFTLREVSISSLEAVLPGVQGFRGELTLQADLQGDPRQIGAIRGRGRLEGSHLTLPGGLGAAGAGTASAEVGLAGGELEVTRAMGRWPGLQLEMTGGMTLLGPRGLHLTLGADLESVAKLWGRSDLGGQATVAAEVNGQWLDPQIVGTVQAPVVRLAASRIEQVRAPFRFLGRTLQVDGADLRLGQSRIGVTGDSTWTGPGMPSRETLERDLRFQVRVQAPAARLEDLDAWLPEGWRGTGTFALTGSLAGTPAAWQGSGVVQAGRLVGPHQLLVQDLRSGFGLDPDRIEIRGLHARVRGVPLSGDGLYAWDGTGRAEAEVGPADLARMPDLPAGAALQGIGKARVQLALRPGILTASGSVALEGISVLDHRVGDGTVLLTLRGRELKGSLAFPQIGLTGTAVAMIGEAGALDLRLTAKDFGLASIPAQALPPDLPRFDGTVSASARVIIPFREPAAARAEVDLDPVRLTLAEERWENRGPVRFRWEAGTLHLDRLQLEGRLGSLTAGGRVNPSGGMDLTLDGQIPLAVLPALSPQIREAGGKLGVTVRIAGSTAHPRLVGEGTIREGRLQLAAYPDALRDLEARFRISPDGLRVVSAVASLGRGRISVGGDLGLDGWRPDVYQFTLKGQEVPVVLTDSLRTTWDLDLAVVGRGPRASISGVARLARGSYTGTVSLLSLLLRRNTGPPAASNTGLPLHVLLQLENDLVVRTDLARFRARGTLNLEGTTANPILFGTLQGQDGQLVFRKHRFTLVSATARFNDPRRIDPDLDILATAQIKDHEVTLNLSGKGDELSVRFSSTPPLPQEDLLTLVAFGVTRDQLGRAGPGLLLGEAAKLLTQEVLGLEPSGIGLDVLEVETGERGERALRVGTQLTQQTRAIFSQPLGASGEHKIRIEYQVVGPLLLAGEQNFQGGYGGDLILRLRFR